MTITGQFEDIHRNTYTVTFQSDAAGENIIIGEGDKRIVFDEDPVVITAEASDLKDTIIKTKCKISLQTRGYVGNLFYAQDARSISVTVTRYDKETRETRTLFRGFVMPVTYTQPFARRYDIFTVNCIDYLSTLKYYNYKHLTAKTYDAYSAQSGVVSFQDLLDDCFDDTDMLKIFDNSKKLTSDDAGNIFAQMFISEQQILDKTYDDMWTQEDVLSEVMKYLNLHCLQRGNTIYMFDWNTVKQMPTTTVTKDIYTSSATSITIDKVITQVTVTDDVNSVDDVVTSPLDTDHITSDYGNSQKFMTEYSSAGEGETALNAFLDMINGRNTDYDGKKIKEWYMQVMRNPNWTLYAPDGTDVYTKIYNQYGNGINQWGALQYTRQNDYTPLLVSFGSRDVKSAAQDTQSYYQRKPAMTNYLMISVNGDAYSRYHHDNYTSYCDNKITNKLEAIATGAGIARFNNITTANINPTEEGTINYLVFEGKFILSPLAYRSASTRHSIAPNAYSSDKFPISYALDGPIYKGGDHCVGGSDNDDGRYYQVRFYNTEKYNDEPRALDTLDLSTPWINEKNITEGDQKWPYDEVPFLYNYSAEGESNDKIWKIPVLACELKVGDKYCCEGYEQDGEAKRSVYYWYTAAEAAQHNVDKIFYLGFDPAIDDYLLNKEWEISSNIDQIKANVDAWGTAIPITKDDMLSGQVDFRILGVVNSTWNNITRRHPTFFRHTSWNTNSYPLLDFVANIFIKDFTCKIYSDNGGATITQDNDIVYVSAETDDYVSQVDEVKFEFITQLTTSECIELGVKNTININSITDGGAGYVRSLYNAKTDIQAKAEEHYVNDYFREMSTPKLELSTDLNTQDYMFTNTFAFSTLGKTMFTTGYSASLKHDTVNLKLREI